ncbi:MAG: YggS family pyridoxal phosphate-dependent enzyme [Verrucomicrobiales bacterium]|nr:YggS family pyridoxal phosphate-dependent enzyme [Verrucomicrobiales bacterium]
MSQFAENLEKIRSRITEAAGRSGRNPEEILLLAVSKTFPPDVIREAFDSGQTHFGENRVQELLTKIPELPPRIEWHLIGHLQSNKVRKILADVDMIQTVDSLDLAQRIDRIAGEIGVFPRVLIQVNIAEDSAKFGFTAEAVRTEMETLLCLERLQIDGLMTIPAFDPDPESARPAFANLRELRDELASEFDLPLTELSMGMSHDFEVAIEEGATIVRVGSALFGKRGKPKNE